MAKLLKMQDGETLEEYPIIASQLRIGRAVDNDIVLHDETVSSYHVVISATKVSKEGVVEEYCIQDLNSTNKTYVNDKEISEQALKDKDVVRVGLAHFEFDVNSSEAAQREFGKTTKLHKSWIPGVFFTKD